jgi:membrane associated rhomboid family serine protease
VKSVVNSLILANVVIFIAQVVVGDAHWLRFALWPLGEHAVPELPYPVGFEPWQLLTSAFLHSTDNLAHLLLNMYGLWAFGRIVERAIGGVRFAWLYLASILAGGVAQLVVLSFAADLYPTIGASGGVFGVLLAFGMLFPHSRVMLIIPPIPMKAWVMVTVYGLIELVAGVTGTMQGVAHFAHLGGMLGALVLMLAWRGRWPPATRDTRDGVSAS